MKMDLTALSLLGALWGLSGFAATTPLDCFHIATGYGLTLDQCVQLCRGSSDASASNCYGEASGVLTVTDALALCSGASAAYDPYDCYLEAANELSSDLAVTLCSAK